jgi:hypothetical protein
MGNVTDGTGTRIKGSKSAYTLSMHESATLEIIQATRTQWEDLTQEQLQKRIVNREDMLELLDILEQGQTTTAAQLYSWRIVEDLDGNTYTAEEANKIDDESLTKLRAKRIAPVWMGDDIAKA